MQHTYKHPKLARTKPIGVDQQNSNCENEYNLQFILVLNREIRNNNITLKRFAARISTPIAITSSKCMKEPFCY